MAAVVLRGRANRKANSPESYRMKTPVNAATKQAQPKGTALAIQLAIANYHVAGWQQYLRGN